MATDLPRWIEQVLSIGMTAAFRGRNLLWRLTKPHITGVQAVILTPAGLVVLVRHRYVKGWHLPGGGVKRGETPQAAAIREAREEIGLASFDSIRPLTHLAESKAGRDITQSVFVISGAVYAPPRTLEIAEVIECAPDALPADAAIARRRVALL